MIRKCVLLFVLLALASPILAQEATPVPESVPPIVVEDGGTVIIRDRTDEPLFTEEVKVALIVSGTLIILTVIYVVSAHRKVTPEEWYRQLPPVITGLAMPTMWQFMYDYARTTAPTSDEEALIDFAKRLGYRVVDLGNGKKVIELETPADHG